MILDTFTFIACVWNEAIIMISYLFTNLRSALPPSATVSDGWSVSVQALSKSVGFTFGPGMQKFLLIASLIITTVKEQCKNH